MRRDVRRIEMVFFLLTFFLSGVFTQIPDGYYSSAQNLTGTELKSALHNIIKGHITFPYTSSGTDTWDILKASDRDPNNPSNVILFYTGWSVNAAQEYANGAGWNREHVWAKSHGPFSETTKGPGTDCHHLRACDISVNSARNNRHFDYGDFEYLDGSLPTGCKTSTSRDVWEPRDVEKGDVARMLFYMATRYEGGDGFPDLEVVDYIPSVTADPEHGVLSTLIEWNMIDPVDDIEMYRNNVVYSYQKNRNPFIDHPEYVNYIWGTPVQPENELPQLANITYSPIVPTSDDIVNFTAHASDSDGTIQSVKLYWGYSSDNLLYFSDMSLGNGSYSASIAAQSAGSEIFFTIEVKDNDNATKISDIQNFTINQVIAIPDYLQNTGFAYPNPSSSVLFVNHNPGELVSLYTIEGRKIIQTIENRMDLSHLSSGLYILQLTDENGKTLRTIKLVKE